nr:MAG TPA: hypothetical protein [Caudoviricetes sp.]DAQ47796.1 MAG TPA: hypothetical protein [Caudoviricetes sp.]DAQ94796.1 MAG TPA: hypothetical protein [Caudoviricetes sp.]DAS54205.1 MAG TPA: hypothetical protein [Caudoviricetes sp.]
MPGWYSSAQGILCYSRSSACSAAGIFSGCSRSHAINRSIFALSCSLIAAYPPDQ